jgi:MFS family permease
MLARPAQDRLGLTRLLPTSVAAYGLGWLLLPAATIAAPVAVLIASAVLVGSGRATYNVAQLTLRQTITPDRLLGRINATMRTLFTAPRPVGALLAGALAALLGYVPALLTGGALSVLSAVPLLHLTIRTDDPIIEAWSSPGSVDRG